MRDRLELLVQGSRSVPAEQSGQGMPCRDCSSAPPFTAYQALFDYFNRALFGDELPAVILNFSRRNRSYGFFAAERWDDGAQQTHEISLNPSHLRTRPPAEVASTLVHEMVHLWQYVYGKPSRTGYHNREWAEKMERVGLIPSDTGAPGGNKTGQHMTHYIEPGGAFERAFQALPADRWLPWSALPEDATKKSPSRSKVAYACPRGHGKVWGRPELLIVCGECGEPYVAE